MINIINRLRGAYLVILCGIVIITSCNKELEQFAPIATPIYPTGNGIAATIAANANYSFYNAMITRAGLAPSLNDLTKTFTLFATDNAGMKVFVNAASGGAVPLAAPDANFLGFISTLLPVASAQAIIQYNTIGQKFASASFGSAFPNYPLPSQIVLDPSQPFVRMPIFPTKGTPFSYVNNIPITGADITAANGIIIPTFTIVAPLPASPLVTLRTLINADANLTYFKAAIARGDSGQVGISGVGAYGLQFDSLMNYPVTNMTVLAPNNAACQTLIFGSVYGALLAQGVPAATASTMATSISSSPAGFNALPVATVRGVVAYHILASKNTGSFKPDIRAFSVNFPSTPTALGVATTLVNGSVAAHPGIVAQATFTGPSVTALKFTGLGTFPPGGAPYSGAAANATAWDRMALNGVLHVIDRVLLPQ
ncbi:MAG: hypothetical protein ABIN01_01475 [Ferruginibacter sp.]